MDVVVESGTRLASYVESHAAFHDLTGNATYLITSVKTKPDWSASVVDINTFDRLKAMLWAFARNGDGEAARSGLFTTQPCCTGPKQIICKIYQPEEESHEQAE